MLLGLIIYVLVGQWINAGNRYCQYGDGSVIVLSVSQPCPFTIER